jgi:hypothetical protein
LTGVCAEALVLDELLLEHAAAVPAQATSATAARRRHRRDARKRAARPLPPVIPVVMSNEQPMTTTLPTSLPYAITSPGTPPVGGYIVIIA